MNITRYMALLMLVLTSIASWGRDYRPADVKNPNIADRRVYVADPEGLVSPQAKAELNNKLWALRQSSSVEMGVAVVPSIGDMEIEEFGEKVFTSWGLGKKDKDNGLLLVIVPEQRKVRIQTGYGVEGVVTDYAARKIINKDVVPHMRQGDLDGALLASTNSLVQLLTDPAVAEELRSEEKEAYDSEEEIDPEALRNVLCGVLAVVFGLAFLLFVVTAHHAKGKTQYEKAIIWRKQMTIFWLLALFSAGTGLLFALMARWRVNRYRNKPINCSTCGAKMHKLNEAEDNELLNPSQDFEERLNTVDYDVWECPQCGTIERFPFRINQNTYSECPNCGTVACYLKCDKTLVPATTRHGGTGEKTYECKFCGHQHKKRYQIPRKESAGVGLAAGAAAAGMGRGGGGGFGGGFGGGMTGGGGASGGW